MCWTCGITSLFSSLLYSYLVHRTYFLRVFALNVAGFDRLLDAFQIVLDGGLHAQDVSGLKTVAGAARAIREMHARHVPGLLGVEHRGVAIAPIHITPLLAAEGGGVRERCAGLGGRYVRGATRGQILVVGQTTTGPIALGIIISGKFFSSNLRITKSRRKLQETLLLHSHKLSSFLQE